MLVRLTFDVGNTNGAQSALLWLKFSGSALLSSDIKKMRTAVTTPVLTYGYER
jgi:hypothetical protein